MMDRKTKKTYTCNKCDQIFKWRWELNKHKIIHVTDTPLKCNTCGKLFVREYYLKEHMDTHVDENKFICRVCGRGFRYEYELGKHVSWYHKDKKLRCNVCGKSYESKAQLDRHRELDHSTKKKFQCYNCGNTFSNNAALMRHVSIKNMYPCKRKEKDNNNADVIVKKKIKFECKRCGNKLSTKAALDYHANKKVRCAKKESSSGDDKEVTKKENYSDVPTRVSVLKCSVCGDAPGFKSSLMDKFKPHNMGMRYICPKCDVNLEKADNLDDYFKTCTNVLKLLKDES